eukprot:3933487-Rhodomonas_salina.1
MSARSQTTRNTTSPCQHREEKNTVLGLRLRVDVFQYRVVFRVVDAGGVKLEQSAANQPQTNPPPRLRFETSGSAISHQKRSRAFGLTWLRERDRPEVEGDVGEDLEAVYDNLPRVEEGGDGGSVGVRREQGAHGD